MNTFSKVRQKLDILYKIFIAWSIVVLGFIGSLATSSLVHADDTPARQNTIERVTTDLDLSKLQLYQFSLKQENMEILDKGNSVIQDVVRPNTDSKGKSWKKSTVFMMKVDRNNKTEQVFDNPLKLKFSYSLLIF